MSIRIIRKMGQLEQDPRPRGDTIKRLQGLATPTFRLRIGDYRAVLRVEGAAVACCASLTGANSLERSASFDRLLPRVGRRTGIE